MSVTSRHSFIRSFNAALNIENTDNKALTKEAIQGRPAIGIGGSVRGRIPMEMSEALMSPKVIKVCFAEYNNMRLYIYIVGSGILIKKSIKAFGVESRLFEAGAFYKQTKHCPGLVAGCIIRWSAKLMHSGSQWRAE